MYLLRFAEWNAEEWTEKRDWGIFITTHCDYNNGWDEVANQNWSTNNLTSKKIKQFSVLLFAQRATDTHTQNDYISYSVVFHWESGFHLLTHLRFQSWWIMVHASPLNPVFDQTLHLWNVHLIYIRMYGICLIFFCFSMFSRIKHR